MSLLSNITLYSSSLYNEKPAQKHADNTLPFLRKMPPIVDD